MCHCFGSVNNLPCVCSLCSVPVVRLWFRLGQWSFILWLDVRGQRFQVADPVQRHPDSEHRPKHGPHWWETDLTARKLWDTRSSRGFSPSAAGGSGNFIYTLATGAQETEVARLVSPSVSGQDSDLCLSFWYHMFGSHIGTLHIKQRRESSQGSADVLLWTVSGHQGNRWREGRVLIPHSNKPYQVLREGDERVCFYIDYIWTIFQIECLCLCLFQVVIESVVERKSWGDIAVDDIKILDSLNVDDCKGECLQSRLHWDKSSLCQTSWGLWMFLL